MFPTYSFELAAKSGLTAQAPVAPRFAIAAPVVDPFPNGASSPLLSDLNPPRPRLSGASVSPHFHSLPATGRDGMRQFQFFRPGEAPAGNGAAWVRQVLAA